MVPIKQAHGYLTDDSLNSEEPGSLLLEEHRISVLPPAKEATVTSEM